MTHRARAQLLIRSVAAGALALLLHAGLASAQTQTAEHPSVSPPSLGEQNDRIVNARADFDRGLQAARADQWGEALLYFRRVYDSTHVPHVLLNIGGALIASGRLRDGADAYRQYLREAPADASELRANTDAALAELEWRIPRVRLDLRNVSARDEIAIDGITSPFETISTPTPLDPGRHVLVVSRDRHVIARHRFELIERQEQRIAIELPAVTERTGSIVRSPLFVAGISILAVGALIAIGAGIYVATDPRFVGNIGLGWTTVP